MKSNRLGYLGFIYKGSSQGIRFCDSALLGTEPYEYIGLHELGTLVII